MNPLVDQYLVNGCMRCELGGTPHCKVHNWTAELHLLRDIVLASGLMEELKWGVPCYTLNGKNVLNISALKHSVVIGFFKGALLQDEHDLLKKPGENSRFTRLMKFTSTSQITANEEEIRDFIKQAIRIEQDGLKVNVAENAISIPGELLQTFESDPLLKKAYYSLTPGRQRGYALYFSQAKQSKTRLARIEKYKDKILRGEGLHDGY
ncbi:MAG TPA: DUF1801 domain-containing protein [Bacteroidales bacterium]|nr:DUF1801 domain-containing protein [Bacteroidales bacterium]